MSAPVPLKPFPVFKSDAAAERFVDEADLSTYDLSGFRSGRAQIGGVASQLSMELPQPLLAALTDRARKRGISPARYIRELIERDITTDVPTVG